MQLMFWSREDRFGVRLKPVTLNLFIGRDPEEVARRQPIFTTIDLWFYPHDVEEYDRAERPLNLDLKAFLNNIVTLCEPTNFALLERLTRHIAEIAFACLPIKEVTVEVMKPKRYGTTVGISVRYTFRRRKSIRRGLRSLSNRIGIFLKPIAVR